MIASKLSNKESCILMRHASNINDEDHLLLNWYFKQWGMKTDTLDSFPQSPNCLLYTSYLMLPTVNQHMKDWQPFCPVIGSMLK